MFYCADTICIKRKRTSKMGTWRGGPSGKASHNNSVLKEKKGHQEQRERRSPFNIWGEPVKIHVGGRGSIKFKEQRGRTSDWKIFARPLSPTPACSRIQSRTSLMKSGRHYCRSSRSLKPGPANSLPLSHQLPGSPLPQRGHSTAWGYLWLLNPCLLGTLTVASGSLWGKAEQTDFGGLYSCGRGEWSLVLASHVQDGLERKLESVRPTGGCYNNPGKRSSDWNGSDVRPTRCGSWLATSHSFHSPAPRKSEDILARK